MLCVYGFFVEYDEGDVFLVDSSVVNGVFLEGGACHFEGVVVENLPCYV